MSYSVPVEGEYEPKRVNWKAIAAELKQHPNQWRKLKVQKYERCNESKATYALKRLRAVGLEADKREHYDEFPGIPDPKTGEPVTVRKPLGTFSVHAMYSQPGENL